MKINALKILPLYLLVLVTHTACNVDDQSASSLPVQTPTPVIEDREDEGSTATEATSIPEELDSLVERLLSREYLNHGFTKINQTPYPSEVSQNKFLDVYVNNDATHSYTQIEPEKNDSFSDLSPGDTIIREVWNTEQQLEKYTLMIKMERGYYPEGGDFLYATVSTDGEIENSGKLDECSVCHIPRESDGYLFGVPGEFHTNNNDSQNSVNDVGLQHLQYSQQLISQKSYLSENQGFSKINTYPYPSDLDDNNLIDVYISKDSLSDYRQIDPNIEESFNKVKPGTVIVREITNSITNERTQTVMIKSLPDYFPEGGDFYYANFNDDGSLQVDDNGQEQTGKLQNCASCHFERKDDGFLFGISSDLK